MAAVSPALATNTPVALAPPPAADSSTPGAGVGNHLAVDGHATRRLCCQLCRRRKHCRLVRPTLKARLPWECCKETPAARSVAMRLPPATLLVCRQPRCLSCQYKIRPVALMDSPVAAGLPTTSSWRGWAVPPVATVPPVAPAATRSMVMSHRLWPRSHRRWPWKHLEAAALSAKVCRKAVLGHKQVQQCLSKSGYGGVGKWWLAANERRLKC